MILNSIITFLANLYLWVSSLLPAADSSILSMITSGVSDIRSSFASVGWFFPVSLFFQLLAFVVIVETSIFTYKLLRLVISFLTGR